MLDLENYSETVRRILDEADGGERLTPLAPRSATSGPGLDLIRSSASAELFGDDTVRSSSFADCTRSALFLYFSALEESHTISQNISSETGSYLHGIMHRQEPDASNAKYWFRRVGRHELFPTLRAEALRLSLDDHALGAAIEQNPEWDPNWFIDQCERYRGSGGAAEKGLLELQRLEWQLLFDYCYRRALTG